MKNQALTCDQCGNMQSGSMFGERHQECHDEAMRAQDERFRLINAIKPDGIGIDEAAPLMRQAASFLSDEWKDFWMARRKADRQFIDWARGPSPRAKPIIVDQTDGI